MSRLSKLRPSPAMAVALLALFIALGGGAYAAIVVTGKNVKNGSLTGVDFKKRSLHGSKLRADSIGGGSIKESTLGPVEALSHMAVVTGAGQLVRGRGVASVARTAAGRYQVIFNREVRSCAYFATVGDASAAGPGTGTASASGLPSSVSGVQVRTVSYNNGGNARRADRGRRGERRCSASVAPGGRSAPSVKIRGVTFETDSAAATEAAGARLADDRLRPGDVVLVTGELGSGKTTFVRGACRALGVEGPVTSPTFTIGQILPGRTEVAHLDLYRLESIAGEDPSLLDDYLTPERIAFVEWPGVGESAIERVAARVRLEHAGGDRRRIEVE